MKLVECVPNFSEGRDKDIIKKITSEIEAVDGVKLLDVDSGASTNRTVVTFVGYPESVLEAAFRAIKKASELIDMSRHKGAHPRQGATDVCPFVPVSGVTMEECVELAHRLGKRVGEELGIPVYMYEYAATRPERRRLADIRAGEYEALPEKLKKPEWKPDYGPSQFNPKAGATVIGARKFLIAYNINLNTKNVRLAKEIASIIRETGRIKKDSNGKKLKDNEGNFIREPGLFKHCMATGWYIEEYGCAQITMNLTDWEVTPIHLVFDKVCELAMERGLRVTGSEIVGLVPKRALLEAGKYYLEKQGASSGVPEKELIEVAIKSLGLRDVAPFDPNYKIIEYAFYSDKKRLINMKLTDFIDEVSLDSPAPGGGSVSAVAGALGISLASMVALLTYYKKGFEEKRRLMNEVAQKAQELKQFFVEAIDKDTEAFNKVIEAIKLQATTEEEKIQKENKLEEAAKEATLVPFSVLERCLLAIELSKKVIEEGNPNSISDAGVSASMISSAALGAYYNVVINLSGIRDEKFKDEMRKKGEEILKKVEEIALQCRERVLRNLS